MYEVIINSEQIFKSGFSYRNMRDIFKYFRFLQQYIHNTEEKITMLALKAAFVNNDLYSNTQRTDVIFK